jgi:hypothetical protein
MGDEIDFFRQLLDLKLAKNSDSFDTVKAVVTALIQPGQPLKGLFKAKDVTDNKLSSTRQRTYFLVRIVAFVDTIQSQQEVDKLEITPNDILANDPMATRELLAILRHVLQEMSSSLSKNQIVTAIKSAKTFAKKQRKRAKDALGLFIKFQAICRGKLTRTKMKRLQKAITKRVGISPNRIGNLKVTANSRFRKHKHKASPRALNTHAVRSPITKIRHKNMSARHTSPSPSQSSLRRSLAAAAAAARSPSSRILNAIGSPARGQQKINSFNNGRDTKPKTKLRIQNPRKIIPSQDRRKDR